MHQLGTSDYVNETQGRRITDSHVCYKTERKLYRLLLLSVGILCIIQAALNVSLRLVASSSLETVRAECNATHYTVKNVTKESHESVKIKPMHCNDLQERFNALTREKNLLENRNNILRNMLKSVTEERDNLRNAQNCDSSGRPVASRECPSDWREINSSCYFLSTVSETWEISRKRCQSKGADLVVIESAHEQRTLQRLDDNNNLFWIGLSNTRTFEWVDGSAVKKAYWSAQSVNNSGPNSNKACVVMNQTAPFLANWEIAPCGLKHRWLCEKRPI